MAAPHPPPRSDLQRAKSALRAHARALRDTLDPALGARVASHLLGCIAIPSGAAVAGTWPIGRELDLRGLWATLHHRGHRVLLPETPASGAPLVFRHWTPETPMLPEPFGTLRPDGPIATPDLIIVPFLAFDAAGHRLGYGGGYYDRTLATLPGVPAIGAGYAALQIPAVPAGPHDRPLDAIVTEHGLAVDRRPR